MGRPKIRRDRAASLPRSEKTKKKIEEPKETQSEDQEGSEEEALENGFAPPAWPSRGEAAKFLGVSLSSIKRYEDQGLLNPVLDEQEVNRFRPSELHRLKEERTNGTVMATAEAANAVSEGAAKAIEATGGVVKSGERHVEKILGMIFEPHQVMLAMFAEENVRLRSRVTELETQQVEYWELLRKYAMEDRERTIAEKKEEAASRRKDQMVGMLQQFAPVLMQQIMSSPGGELANEIPTDKLCMLLSPHVDILSPEQKQKLLSLLSPEKRTEVLRALEVLKGGEAA